MPLDTLFAGAASPHALLPLSSLYPAHKLLAACFFSLPLCLLKHPETTAVSCLFPLVLMALGRLPWKILWQRLLPVNLFFLLLWLTLPFTFNANYSDTLVSFGGIVLSKSRLIFAGVLTIKGNVMAATLLTLAGTSSLPANGQGLLELKIPQKLVTLLLLTYSNIELLMQEAARLFAAAKLRGFTPKTTLFSYKTAAYLAAMLLVRSWERSLRVADAMRLRGFQGTFPLIDAAPPRLVYRLVGRVLVAVACLFSSGLCVLEYLFY